MKAVADDEPECWLGGMCERPSHDPGRQAGIRQDAPERTGQPLVRGAWLVSDQTYSHERMRKTMVRQQIDAPPVVSGVIAGRRSDAGLGRIHSGGHRRPHRIGLRRADRRKVNCRASFDHAAEVRQPPFRGSRQDEFERSRRRAQSPSPEGLPRHPRPGRTPTSMQSTSSGTRRRRRARQAATPAKRRPRSQTAMPLPGCHGARMNSAGRRSSTARAPRRWWPTAPAVMRRAASSPSACENPRTLSHISTAAAAESAADSHARTRTLAHPGDIALIAKNSRATIIK